MSVSVWLGDLTHTQQTIASDVVPAAIGMIGEFLLANCPHVTDLKLFKYPEDLAAALEREPPPHVIGLSNYVWNSRLSLAFLETIRRHHPQVVTVMGGPNFPTVADEQRAFMAAHPWVDFYIVKEAERAFLLLVQALCEVGFDRSRVVTGLPNLVSASPAGPAVISTRLERVMDLTTIPSPYLSGRLDEFLDGRLLPVIQTNRGCPFSCAFCTEGQAYWNKVRHKSADLIRSEITLIAGRMNALPPERRRHDLLIADSNFGMFPEDLDTCRVIAEVQEHTAYPRYINVATGKNRKERVLEAARIVKGAMKLAGSVQSLDPEVQKNMKRSNISAGQIVELALKAGEIGTNTYSEVILNLPGDTLRAHFDTLRTLVEAQFNTISMYQLMILPGTEFGLESTKTAFAMVCRYRVLPRAFGRYHLLGEELCVAEIEEICVQNSTMPYADYLQCRRMNLIVNLFYNDSIFAEILKVLRWQGLSVWGWLMYIFERRWTGDFEELVAKFLEETENELWEDSAALAAFTCRSDVIDRYTAGELGSNLMFKYKALSMTTYFAGVCETARQAIHDYLAAGGPVPPEELPAELPALMDEIIDYKKQQVEGLFDLGLQRRREQRFVYDIARLGRQETPVPLAMLRRSSDRPVVFAHTAEQRRMIEGYIDIFGNDVVGLTRILSRIFLKQVFRTPFDPDAAAQDAA